jgi:D-aminoacyl-tRNA deacylase
VIKLSYFSTLTIVLVASKVDVASRNMALSLINRHNFKSTGIIFDGEFVYARDNMLLIQIKEEPVYPPNLDSFFNPYAYIFLSRHSASSQIPSITVHSTGNFGTAKLGGNDFEIGRTEPNIIKNMFFSLKRREKELKGHKITLEATHHGPTSLSKPCVFVEIGSSEREWNNRETAGYVSDAILESVEKGNLYEKVGIAFGGTHYPDKFNRFLSESDIAVSYVVPRYSIESIDERMLEQMIGKSLPRARYAILDWKGLGKEKGRLIELINKFGLDIVKL